MNQRLAAAALDNLRPDRFYNGAYVRLDYPFGDVPETQGVCTDVIIRAYRGVGIDLQSRVHEDMKKDFAAYPENWGLSRPDSNIDHRRVPNLRVFFKRNGQSLRVTQNAANYRVGDLVTWNVGPKGGRFIPHIGIVSSQKAPNGQPMIVHHIAGTPQLEPVLFSWPVTGHYRYLPIGQPDNPF